MKNTLENVKKFITKELEKVGDKIRFTKVEDERLHAVITREDGTEDKVYWKLDLRDGVELLSTWYYTEL